MLPPSSGWSEDGDSTDLLNIGVIPQHYTASQPRPQLETLILAAVILIFYLGKDDQDFLICLYF